jgi:hypothetical protein
MSNASEQSLPERLVIKGADDEQVGIEFCDRIKQLLGYATPCANQHQTSAFVATESGKARVPTDMSTVAAAGGESVVASVCGCSAGRTYDSAHRPQQIEAGQGLCDDLLHAERLGDCAVGGEPGKKLS